MFRRGLLSTGFPMGFSLGSAKGPVTTGGNRKVLRDHQGVTEHVKWSSVQNGFPFGFLRKVLMFLSTFNLLGITKLFSGGLFNTGFTLGFTGQHFALIQGITKHDQRMSGKHGFHCGFLFGFHNGSCHHRWQQESALRSPGYHRACSAEVCSKRVSLRVSQENVYVLEHF